MSKKDKPSNEWVGGKQAYPNKKDNSDDDWLSNLGESVLGSPIRKTNKQVENDNC